MISLYDLLEAANGQLFGEPAAQLFTAFCLDSQLAEDNHLYVTRKTDQGDTHQYIREAVDRGARGVLCTDPPNFDTDGISVIIVKDTEASLMAWARFVLKKLGTYVIAVTGSSGKSVAAEAISQVLSTRYRVHMQAQPQKLGRLRLPMALASLKAEHNFVVMELGASQVGDMSEMVQTLQPEVGVVTHIGYAYTSAFDTLEQIAREEGTLVEYLPSSGLAVLNYDDDLVRKMATRTRAHVMTVGTADFGADFMAYNMLAGLTKTGFDLRHASDRYVGRWTPLLGKHQLYGILSALAVGTHYDIEVDDSLKALTEMKPLPGRMSPLHGQNGSLLVDDTYDATPQSTLAALDWLQSVGEPHTRRIFIMGDMGDLGAYSQRGHRMIGQRAAEVADLIVTEGGEASQVGRAAMDQGMDRRKVIMTYSAQDAVAVFTERYPLQANDVVLIKGGKSAHMEAVTQALLQDERDRTGLVRQGAGHQGTALQPMRTTWVEINKAALAKNTRLIKQMIGPNVRLMAVVKADAYGHGAVAASITALANGAEALAVASINEALELRDASIDAPILVMSYTPVSAVRQAIRNNITLTLYDLDLAHAYNQTAREVGSKLNVHVKIDTGMGRLGVLANEAIAFFRQISNMQQLEVEGIYTHYSMSDEDSDYTAQQLRAFKGVLNPVRGSGFNFKYIHTANSAAVLTNKDTYFNTVRAGIALYGLSPSDFVRVPPEFEPVMSWKTVVAQVKTLPAGSPIGYGQTYITQGQERIAVLPVGYAYGFRRKPYAWERVLVHDQFAPVVGRVAMEKVMINVTDIPDVAIGDEVVLLGKQGANEITADEVARSLQTNNYEVVCNVMARIPRR